MTSQRARRKDSFGGKIKTKISCQLTRNRLEYPWVQRIKLWRYYQMVGPPSLSEELRGGGFFISENLS